MPPIRRAPFRRREPLSRRAAQERALRRQARSETAPQAALYAATRSAAVSARPGVHSVVSSRPFSQRGTMKRKYGKAKNRETIAEQRMREAAKMMGDNSHNYGSDSRKGAISRG